MRICNHHSKSFRFGLVISSGYLVDNKNVTKSSRCRCLFRKNLVCKCFPLFCAPLPKTGQNNLIRTGTITPRNDWPIFLCGCRHSYNCRGQTSKSLVCGRMGRANCAFPARYQILDAPRKQAYITDLVDQRAITDLQSLRSPSPIPLVSLQRF